MAYLLGSQACIESLQTDVQDLQLIISDIVSRVGPIKTNSWKFPDKLACDLDIKDLLDLYSCDDKDDVEDRQVSHIALYELTIDRLVLMVKAITKFIDVCLNRNSKNQTCPDNGESEMSSSVGLTAKQHWSNMVRLHTWLQQLLSEKNSGNGKIAELTKESGKHMADFTTPASQTDHGTQIKPLLLSPGTFGMVPPNNADLVMMGLAPLPEKKNNSISRDVSHKSCQTFETAFVPCESCDIIQRKMREGSEIVIKSCVDQGLPCSLKKFKSQVAHVELLTFNDVCRWMAEQTKDIARIAKQNEILQASVNPLKAEVKEASLKVKSADEKYQVYEKKLADEKEAGATLCSNFEIKLKDQEKQHNKVLNEEKKKKEDLMKEKDKLDQELKKVRIQLETQMKAMKKLEKDFKKLEVELKEKSEKANKSSQVAEAMVALKVQLEDATAQMNGYQKALAKEQGKCRGLSKHNESLQAKQESLLSKMGQLGKENEEAMSQVAALEEENDFLDDKLLELISETNKRKKKIAENEVIIKNLEEEKKSMEESLKESHMSVERLESELRDAKERERIIVEYPDLNGPVNKDLQGTGDITTDMKNQVTANRIRIRLLEEQNQSLNESVRKLSGLQKDSYYGMTGDTQLTHKAQPLHGPIHAQPLWQQGISNNNNNSNYLQSHDNNNQSSYRDHLPPQNMISEKEDWPRRKKLAWETNSDHVKVTEAKNPASEFLIGHGFSKPQHGHQQESSSMERPHSSKMRATSAKLKSVMVPVNATPIGAYTHMKKALGIGFGKDSGKKVQPPTGNLSPLKPHVSLFEDHKLGQNSELPLSCPRCDKMYSLARDLENHKTYCCQ